MCVMLKKMPLDLQILPQNFTFSKCDINKPKFLLNGNNIESTFGIENHESKCKNENLGKSFGQSVLFETERKKSVSMPDPIIHVCQYKKKLP